MPQGSAVFETLAERPLTGAVLDLPLTRGYATMADGVLEFTDGDRGPSRLTFAADDVEVGSSVFGTALGVHQHLLCTSLRLRCTGGRCGNWACCAGYET